MTAALKHPLPAHDAWESFIEQHEEGDEGAIEACARSAELEAVLSFLRRKGSLAYLTRKVYQQEVLVELIGELERGEHRRG